MKKHAATLVMAALTGLAIGTQGSTGLTIAQEEAASSKPAVKKTYRRLPNYFGQIGLSNEQREEIYSIQEKAGEQLEALKRQIEAVTRKRDSDVRAVLTDDQKKRLDELIAAARKRAEERRKKKGS